MGTFGYGTITAPGNDPLVITVGAMNTEGSQTRTDDLMTTYSSKGPTAIDHIAKPDLMAPGNQVTSMLASGSQTLATDFPGDRPLLSVYESGAGSSSKSQDYFVLSGTSMAAPVVSAAAALLIQQNPAITPDQVKARLMRTAYKNLPASVTIVTGGQTFVEQADVFTVGAGYLDIQAALSDTSLAKLSAMSPVAVYNSSTHSVSLESTSTAVWGSKALW